MRFPIISTAKKVRFPKNLCLNKAYTKSFDKNSSLVTKAYKALEYNALQCDELYFQLITPKSPSQGCDEFIQQLITLQQTGGQHVTLHCDEWRVFIKTFLGFLPLTFSDFGWLHAALVQKQVDFNTNLSSDRTWPYLFCAFSFQSVFLSDYSWHSPPWLCKRYPFTVWKGTFYAAKAYLLEGHLPCFERHTTGT